MEYTDINISEPITPPVFQTDVKPNYDHNIGQFEGITSDNLADPDDDVGAMFDARKIKEEAYEGSLQQIKDKYAQARQNAVTVSFNERFEVDEFGIPLYEDDGVDIHTRMAELQMPESGTLNSWLGNSPEWLRRMFIPFLDPALKHQDPSKDNWVARGLLGGGISAARNMNMVARELSNILGADFDEETWKDIPKLLGESTGTGEDVVNGLTQFLSVFAGLGGFSKGATLFQQTVKGGVADFLFDPEEGNIATAIRSMGVENEFLAYLDSQVGEDADDLERLEARLVQAAEGGVLGVAITKLIPAVVGAAKYIKESFKDMPIEQQERILARAFIPSPYHKAVTINTSNVEKVKPLKASDFKRNKDGTYVGFSKTINTPQKMTKLIKQIESFAKEGEKGRMWYENSSKAIMKVAGGDPKEAEILAQIIAVTSQSTGVKTNTGFALKAYSQWKAGMPIDTGRFPKAQSEKITNILNGVPWEGRKTNSFYRNLMVYIDPKVAGELPTTQDMWMARAFNLDSDAPTAAQYENMERVTKNIADQLGWKPHQVQAAVWVAVKGRFDPVKASITKHAKEKGWLNSKGEVLPKYQKKYDKYFNEKVFDAEFDEEAMLKAAYDYSNGIEDNLGNIALEAIPSVTEGSLRGIHNALPEQQAEFTKDMYEIFLNEDGVDELAKEIGILSPDNFSGYGGWQGAVNESIQLRAVMSGTDKGGINAADQELMDIYASVVGTVFKQDGVSYRRAFNPKNSKEANGVLVELEDARPLTQEETQRLYKALEDEFGDQWTSPIPSQNGVELINYTDDIDNITFKQKVKNAIINADLPDSTTASFRSEGKLLENDWEKYPDGQGYGQGFTERSSTIYNRLVSKYGEKAEEIRKSYADKYGWDKAEGSTSSSPVVPAAFVAAKPEEQNTEDFIKSFEGYQNKGYYATEAEKSAGIVTAGYGSTRRVAEGEKITKKQAEKYFKEDLAVAEKAVDSLVTVSLNPNQRSAVVSLIFNVGQGNFKKSKALKALNKGDLDTFMKEAFDSKVGFVRSGGKVLKGLVKRREAERKLFEGIA
jgi:lysozyme